MSKPRDSITASTLILEDIFINTVSFLDFWQYIAKQIGSARIKINVNTSSIHHFVYSDCGFIKDIVRTSYSKSECYHLQSPVDVNKTLDALGEHAYQLNENLDADLLDIELLEEIAWHISERFLEFVDLPNKTKTKSNATIISMPMVKIRRANNQH